MKNLIKKILREQWSPEAIQDLEAFHPDLFELDEQETIGSGKYGDPIMDTSSGNVPPQSYDAGSYTHTKEGISHTSPVSKIAFFKAAQLVSKMKDDRWFTQNEDGGQSTYYRTDDMETPLKVVGINKTGIGD